MACMSTESEAQDEREVRFGTEAFEIVAWQWRRSGFSAAHDHRWSQCYVFIESGRFENSLDRGIGREVAVYEAGQVISTPLGSRHQMRCLSATGTTMHFYTPRLANAAEAAAPNFAAPTLG